MLRFGNSSTLWTGLTRLYSKRKSCAHSQSSSHSNSQVVNKFDPAHHLHLCVSQKNQWFPRMLTYPSLPPQSGQPPKVSSIATSARLLSGLSTSLVTRCLLPPLLTFSSFVFILLSIQTPARTFQLAGQLSTPPEPEGCTSVRLGKAACCFHACQEQHVAFPNEAKQDRASGVYAGYHLVAMSRRRSRRANCKVSDSFAGTSVAARRRVAAAGIAERQPGEARTYLPPACSRSNAWLSPLGSVHLP
jgi:hypothetical protein